MLRSEAEFLEGAFGDSKLVRLARLTGAGGEFARTWKADGGELRGGDGEVDALDDGDDTVSGERIELTVEVAHV